MMGLEEHLLNMFRGDFEFHEDAAPSHLSNGLERPAVPAQTEERAVDVPVPGEPCWAPEASTELHKIPFFVRGKARRNTERYAAERGLATITIETLYDAKAHFGR
jgi:light-independent protochlorophyllide reductase subunit B